MPPSPPAPRPPRAARRRPRRPRRRRPAPARPQHRPPRVPATGRVKASPLARRIAAERGIDLGGIAGLGARGSDRAAGPRGSAAPAPGRPPPLPRRRPPAPAPRPGRRAARRTARPTPTFRSPRSGRPSPAGWRSRSARSPRSTSPPRWTWSGRGTRARGSRRSARARRCRSTTSSSRPSPRALRQHPACNAWWQDDRIRYWHEVHVSMAVAIEDGLITPVIRNTDLKSLREIAAESHDLAGARARAPAHARGVHRRHLLGLEPGHARHRRVHGRHQSAGGRDPGGRPDCSESGSARGAAGGPTAAPAHHVAATTG